ncbi:hypothetical protein D1614_16275 [Maribellus luteus]|uniref:Uncharacterized protein n=1 Tax=Maribellus luteus TaxID=2305463 RepID=A0A399ST03_9BACT|nr:hypothetical protein D1614_16275 [Maribellus luteus]
MLFAPCFLKELASQARHDAKGEVFRQRTAADNFPLRHLMSAAKRKQKRASLRFVWQQTDGEAI